MSPRREVLDQLAVFVLLVAIGVVGRWGQPDWHFTPVAAVGALAGYFFARSWLALLVPAAVLAISNLVLGDYEQLGVMATVYATLMLAPFVVGRRLKRRPAASRLAIVCVLPATLFYATTNFAHWRLTGQYPQTAAGLIACYEAAIPFYWKMLAGDVFYTGVLFGGYALATAPRRTALARDPIQTPNPRRLPMPQ